MPDQIDDRFRLLKIFNDAYIHQFSRAKERRHGKETTVTTAFFVPSGQEASFVAPQGVEDGGFGLPQT